MVTNNSGDNKKIGDKGIDHEFEVRYLIFLEFSKFFPP